MRSPVFLVEHWVKYLESLVYVVFLWGLQVDPPFYCNSIQIGVIVLDYSAYGCWGFFKFINMKKEESGMVKIFVRSWSLNVFALELQMFDRISIDDSAVGVVVNKSHMSSVGNLSSVFNILNLSYRISYSPLFKHAESFPKYKNRVVSLLKFLTLSPLTWSQRF